MCVAIIQVLGWCPDVTKLSIVMRQAKLSENQKLIAIVRKMGDVLRNNQNAKVSSAPSYRNYQSLPELCKTQWSTPPDALTLSKCASIISTFISFRLAFY